MTCSGAAFGEPRAAGASGAVAGATIRAGTRLGALCATHLAPWVPEEGPLSAIRQLAYQGCVRLLLRHDSEFVPDGIQECCSGGKVISVVRMWRNVRLIPQPISGSPDLQRCNQMDLLTCLSKFRGEPSL